MKGPDLLGCTRPLTLSHMFFRVGENDLKELRDVDKVSCSVLLHPRWMDTTPFSSQAMTLAYS